MLQENPKVRQDDVVRADGILEFTRCKRRESHLAHRAECIFTTVCYHCAVHLKNKKRRREYKSTLRSVLCGVNDATVNTEQGAAQPMCSLSTGSMYSSQLTSMNPFNVPTSPSQGTVSQLENSTPSPFFLESVTTVKRPIEFSILFKPLH